MKSVGFLILFVGFLNLFGLSCKALYLSQVLLQSNETTVIPDSTVELEWTFAGDPSKATLLWRFKGRRVGSKKEEIARKYHTEPAIMKSSSLPSVEFKPPATLVLKNVDERYNGKYWFNVQVAGVVGGEALVELYIAVKPNVTINCSSPIKLNEGDNFTCLCRGEGGNPPANVTWYRNETQFGETKTENNTLTRTDVDETDNTTFTCFAQSYPDPIFEDSKTVVVQVKFEPKDWATEFLEVSVEPKETTIEFTTTPGSTPKKGGSKTSTSEKGDNGSVTNDGDRKGGDLTIGVATAGGVVVIGILFGILAYKKG